MTELKLYDWKKKPDYVKIWKLRGRRINFLKKNDNHLRRINKFYKTNPVEWINDWGVTYDPRRKNAIVPFILFPRQVEFIHYLYKKWQNGEDGVCEKSRDMGVTWLCVAFSVWLWNFHSGTKIGFGSRKKEYVDELGNPDSIFEKIRIFIKNLPGFFLPSGFDYEENMHQKKIINKKNGSTIIGEIGKNIGRGGRSTIYFKDESAFYEKPELIDRSLSLNSEVKIDVSTHNGTNTIFYRKIQMGILEIFTFHWTQDPRKNQAWYDRMCKEYAYDPVLIAQEIDINPMASVARIVIKPEYVQAATNVRVEQDGMKIAGFDVADDGGDENVVIWRKGLRVKGIDGWIEGNTTQSTRRAFFICKQENIEVLKYDSIGVGAGVKGETWSLLQETKNQKGTKIYPQGVHYGSKPTPGNYAPAKSNRDMFANLKAQLWWELRRRFQNTYEMVKHIKKHKQADLISIPDDRELIRELSSQQYDFNKKGQLIMVKKEEMAKSPNRADALVICFSRTIGLDYNKLTTL